MNKKYRSGRRDKFSPFQVIVTALTILFAFNFIIFTARIRSESRHIYPYKYTELSKEMQRGDYSQFAEDVYCNIANNVKTAVNTDAFSGVADYYETALLAHAYETVGDSAKTAALKEKLADIEAAVTDIEMKAAISDIKARYLLP